MQQQFVLILIYVKSLIYASLNAVALEFSVLKRRKSGLHFYCVYPGTIQMVVRALVAGGSVNVYVYYKLPMQCFMPDYIMYNIKHIYIDIPLQFTYNWERVKGRKENKRRGWSYAEFSLILNSSLALSVSVQRVAGYLLLEYYKLVIS